MAATRPPVCDFGRKAVDFALEDPWGKQWTLDLCRGGKGTLVMFICNHCPFVKGIIDRLVVDTRELKELGVGSVAIMANDWDQYPEDRPERMASVAGKMGFPFPYLIDRTQEIAKAYGAVCTPDFFGYNSAGELQYRGRLDAGGSGPRPDGAERELFAAMLEIGETGRGPIEQHTSIGCSIKWRDF